MRADFLSRLLPSTLVLLIVLPAHAENQDAKGQSSSQSQTQQTIAIPDGLHLQVDIVQIPSTKLSTTTDLPPGSEQLIQAVRAAVKDGTGSVKYTLESPLVVGRDLLMKIGSQEPFTRGRNVSKDGRINIQTNYEDVGCRINIETQHIGEAVDDGVFMQAHVEWSDLRLKSGVVVADDLEAPIFVNQSCQFATTLKPGTTFAFRMGAKRPGADEAWTSVIVTTLSEEKPAS